MVRRTGFILRWLRRRLILTPLSKTSFRLLRYRRLRFRLLSIRRKNPLPTFCVRFARVNSRLIRSFRRICCSNMSTRISNKMGCLYVQYATSNSTDQTSCSSTHQCTDRQRKSTNARNARNPTFSNRSSSTTHSRTTPKATTSGQTARLQ